MLKKKKKIQDRMFVLATGSFEDQNNGTLLLCSTACLTAFDSHNNPTREVGKLLFSFL